MLLLGHDTLYYDYRAIALLMLFMASLTFGFTIMLIYMLFPHGSHRRGRDGG